MYLRPLRYRHHWTQDELARRSHVPQNTISRLERNERARPQWVTVLALAKALDVAPDSIQFGLPPVPLPRLRAKPRTRLPLPGEVQP